MGEFASSSPKELLNALSLYENILHSEEQAIRARDLSTINSILEQKEISLKGLVSAKINADHSHLDLSDLGPVIERVISMQRKNTDAFRGLHIQEAEDERCKPGKDLNVLRNRLRRAYRH